MKGQTNAVLTLLTGDILNLKLVTNLSSHEDLVGTTITIDYGIVKTFTWEGKDITVQIPQFLDYTVTVSDVEGYVTPNAQTFTAKINNVNNLVMLYNTELVTVNVTPNNIENYEITIRNKYTKLDYIESTGTQYIDTGFKPNQDTRVVFSGYNTSTSSGWTFGTWASSSSNQYAFSCNKSYSFRYGTKNVALTQAPVGSLEVDFNKNNYSYNDTTGSFETQLFTCTYTMYLFAINAAGSVSNGKYTGRVYSCKIYDNGVLIRDYIPVKYNLDGTCGLLDLVNDIFYPSKGVDGFILGNVAEEGFIVTLTESTASYKIPYGTEYLITANNITGYTTPAEQSFTASLPLRNIDLVYEELLLGVYIYGTDGKLYDVDSWEGGSNAIGVAIITDNCSFVVAKEDVKSSYVYWGGCGTDISTLINYTDTANAATDFDGVNNTSKIIAAIGNTNDGYRKGTAAGDCAAYTFPNGKTGYLGSAGEWQVARHNKDTLNNALTLIGGTKMKSSTYWTSTEYDSEIAWFQKFNSYSDLDCERKDDSYAYACYIRAFTSIN